MSPPSLLRFLHRHGTSRTAEGRRWAPGCQPALLGMTPEEQLGRNLKSMIWLRDVGVGFYQLPFQDVGLGGAQTGSTHPSPGAPSSPFRGVRDIFLVSCPTPPRQETRCPSLFPSPWPTMVVLPWCSQHRDLRVEEQGPGTPAPA